MRLSHEFSCERNTRNRVQLAPVLILRDILEEAKGVLGGNVEYALRQFDDQWRP
jgi:hypothetical protein